MTPDNVAAQLKELQSTIEAKFEAIDAHRKEAGPPFLANLEKRFNAIEATQDKHNNLFESFSTVIRGDINGLQRGIREMMDNHERRLTALEVDNQRELNTIERNEKDKQSQRQQMIATFVLVAGGILAALIGVLATGWRHI